MTGGWQKQRTLDDLLRGVEHGVAHVFPRVEEARVDLALRSVLQLLLAMCGVLVSGVVGILLVLFALRVDAVVLRCCIAFRILGVHCIACEVLSEHHRKVDDVAAEKSDLGNT